MIEGNNEKHVVLLHELTTAGEAQTTSGVDCLGHDFCVLEVNLGTHATSAGSQISVLTIGESNDNTTFASITGLVGASTGAAGTSTNFTIPGVNSSASQIALFELDLTKRKRYINVSLTTPVATPVCIKARMVRSDVKPVSTTNRGVTVIARPT